MSLSERVLSCRSLPTLPAVAVEVLRLTRDPGASVKRMAKVVQSDQGLAAKVLKTVNSPLYGLSEPCKTIERALAYLGQNAVKSIVLGFSLIDSARDVPSEHGFDIEQYWKRVIYSAAAARQVASQTLACDPDEAFTGGLFQDMGMLAMAVALGEEYGPLLREARRHAQLPEIERHELGFDHTEVGAALAERWRLPQSMIECVHHHHLPERAAPDHRSMVCAIAFGRQLASELLAPAERRSLSGLRATYGDWFGCARMNMADLIGKVTEDATEMARVFEKSLDEICDLDDILAEAQEQLVDHQLSVAREADHLLEQTITDALTGVRNRKSFDETLARLFAGDEPLTVLFIDADRFKSVNDTHGHAAGDAVLKELAERMTRAVGGRGTVFRYGGEEFAVLAPGAGPADAAELGEQVRQAVRAAPFDISMAHGPADLAVTISVGVATHTAQAPAPSGEELVRAADDAVYQSKQAGRDRVTVAGTHPCAAESAPEPEAAEPEDAEPDRAPEAFEPVCILLVEDDALAAAVIRAKLARRPDVAVVWQRSGAGARSYIEACDRGEQTPPDLMLCDMRLERHETGVEVIRAVRQSVTLASIPIWAMSASEAGEDARAGAEAGADSFHAKDRIIGSLPQWIDDLVATARAA
ncbi:MAG: HDOD domain-containing protein [Phycisphaerales bacterium JB039]